MPVNFVLSTLKSNSATVCAELVPAVTLLTAVLPALASALIHSGLLLASTASDTVLSLLPTFVALKANDFAVPAYVHAPSAHVNAKASGVVHETVISIFSAVVYVVSTVALPVVVSTIGRLGSAAIAPLPTVIIAPASIRAAKLFFVISQNPPFQFSLLSFSVSKLRFPFSVSVLPALPFYALPSAAVRPLPGTRRQQGFTICDDTGRLLLERLQAPKASVFFLLGSGSKPEPKSVRRG